MATSLMDGCIGHTWGQSAEVTKKNGFVLKRPLGGGCWKQLDIENNIYHRIGRHPYVARYFGVQSWIKPNDSIVLEPLRETLRERLHKLMLKGEKLDRYTVLRWAWQICIAYHHIHEVGVMHVDIGGQNVMVDAYDHLRLIDFAGSSLDGSAPTIYPSVRFKHPDYKHSTKLGVPPTVQTELFAIGSLLYEMETTKIPYIDQTEVEIGFRFKDRRFPDVSEMTLGNVIKKCWEGEFTNAYEVAMGVANI